MVSSLCRILEKIIINSLTKNNNSLIGAGKLQARGNYRLAGLHTKLKLKNERKQ